MNNNYKEITNCVCCNNNRLVKVLDLQDQPLANNNLVSKDESEDKYPLAINYCSECTHLQLTVAVNPDLLFKNYLYVTGTSQTMKNYLDFFVDYTLNLDSNPENVLDIGCNDGTLLDIYKKKGIPTYGIDPSENLFKISSLKHNVICDYLNESHAKKFANNFSIIIAHNVFAHTESPLEFLSNCKEMIKEDGLIFIQTSQANMVENNEFDTIYHEHISFFSIESFKALARRAGLKLIEHIKTPLHGTSHLFILSKDPNSQETKKTDKFKLNYKTINEYTVSVEGVAKDLRAGLEKIRSEGYKVIGYGAAAKGSTLTNYADLDFDYIIDDNPLKQGLFTPGKHCEILPLSKLKEEFGKVCIVPLAWNFFDEIYRNCVNVLSSDDVVFIKYFPELEIINVKDFLNED